MSTTSLFGGSIPVSRMLLNQMWQKSSVSPVYFGLRVSSHEWAMAGISGSAAASTSETVESDLTELTAVSGSTAHMCLFTAWVLVIYSILVICVLKWHTYLHRCKIGTKQNKLTLECWSSVFLHRRPNTQALICLLCGTCRLWGWQQHSSKLQSFERDNVQEIFERLSENASLPYGFSKME